MDKKSPIGIFDSGMGGLTTTRQIAKLLPQEDLLYLGDSIHNPYGTKTPEEITGYCMKICDDFMKRDVKAIVIACNTATSAAVPELRKRYPVEVVGVEPALKVAADKGGHQKIAVWATALTLAEKKFNRLLSRFNEDHQITEVACPGLVELVENDELHDTEKVKDTLREYLRQSGYPDLDTIVLGCTHFIFFRHMLEEMVDGRVSIVDGNSGTARHLKDLLEKADLLQDEDHQGSIEIRNSDPGHLPLAKKLYQYMEVDE